MPKYLYHFDACMIPFKINPITEATDPVKLYEYLSAGKPVVTVALPEVNPYREYVYVAKDRDDFVKQLDRAVSEENRDLVNRRISFAREQTWAQRYERIEEGVSSVTPRASIVVVTYNNLALNKLCLESILRNTDYPNYEVIVVDNNSTDGTHSYLRYLGAQYSHRLAHHPQDTLGAASTGRAKQSTYQMLGAALLGDKDRVEELVRRLAEPFASSFKGSKRGPGWPGDKLRRK